MTESAARLVGHVLTRVLVRQWVLSLAYRLRYLVAWNHDPCRAVPRGLGARPARLPAPARAAVRSPPRPFRLCNGHPGVRRGTQPQRGPRWCLHRRRGGRRRAFIQPIDCTRPRQSRGRGRVTHPFHPLCGREFDLVSHRHAWSQDRVCVHDDHGQLISLPARWTSAVAEDPFVRRRRRQSSAVRPAAVHRRGRRGGRARRGPATCRRSALSHAGARDHMAGRAVTTQQNDAGPPRHVGPRPRPVGQRRQRSALGLRQPQRDLRSTRSHALPPWRANGLARRFVPLSSGTGH